MKKILFSAAIIAAMLLTANVQEAQAQQKASNPSVQTTVREGSEAYRLLGNMKPNETKVFAYNVTPDFALQNQNKNFWRKLTPQQMQVLEQYGCPKFVSNGMNSLELDVVTYQKAFKKWDADNMYRQTEILNALGIKK